MRFRLVIVAILLAVASRGYGRPRDPDPLDSSQEVTTATLGAAYTNGSPDSSKDRPRELKDIQSMDQSLRTVATQLLNSTKRDDLIRMPGEKIVTIETPMQVVQVSTIVEDVGSDNENNEEDNSTKMKFGIPMNSKFGHFEITNPGHAMAMTDEEIEKEMATAMTPDKKQLTTPSLLSTWIQLYPLSSTTESSNVSETKINDQSNQIFLTTSTKLPSSIIKQTIASTKPTRKTESKSTTVSTVKTTEPPLFTKVMKNTSTSSTPNFVKISTTTLTTSFENDIDEVETTDKKNPVSTTAKSSTKKSSNKSSTTPKLKISTPKNSTINKSPKPNNSSNRIKPHSTRRPALNNDTVTSTSKIEKVTIKPLSTVPQNHTTSTNRPMFITKIRASLSDVQKSTTPTSTTSKSVNTIISKSDFTQSESSIIKVPNPTRVNNVLKVHLKKPTDDMTKIEIQPIRVNPPVLTIEKISDHSSDQKTDEDVLNNSKIDVKFDFDSEVSKVEIQTQPSVDTTTTAITASTSKKPRSPGKRKKNKNRRRKTSTTSTTSSSTNISSDEESQTSSNSITIDDLQVTGIQESKIEPESKVSPSKKKKPNQQTQIQKPISSQIYNFISREVMPSVGVMSLVGLGLGLASYFLYPFGGVITRRNYDVEPNYKYNIDEYGGNYGLNEEEVLSKVYSGMTGGQPHEAKYRLGEKSPNYYRYTASEHPYHQPSTRYPGPTIKNNGNRVFYRPVETTAHGTNYRNTDFKYSEVPTTPNYYERQRQQQKTDFGLTVSKAGIGNNRQFVVGNIPKEYSGEEVDKMVDIVKLQDKSEQKLQYQVDKTYNDNSPVSTLSVSSIESAGSPAALVSKVDEEQTTEVLENVKINTSGSLVEHGPRSLKFDDESKVEMTASKSIRKKRGILPDIAGSFIPVIKNFNSPRKERNSVIQVIPSKSEIEKEKKEEAQEEDLSNEILDIIDDALPGKQHQKKHGEKDYITDASYQHTKASITTAAKKTSTLSTVISSTETKNNEKTEAFMTSTTTTQSTSTEPDFVDQGETTLDWRENISTTSKPQSGAGGIDIIGIAKRIAGVKLRLGLTLLKHASEGFAKYIGHIQKRFNGEE